MATSFFNNEKVSEWLLDISKYVTTGVVITSLMGVIDKQWLLYTFSVAVILGTLFFSMWFSNRHKNK
jgi:ABC-type multidrug transport system permease subunit